MAIAPPPAFDMRSIAEGLERLANEQAVTRCTIDRLTEAVYEVVTAIREGHK